MDFLWEPWLWAFDYAGYFKFGDILAVFFAAGGIFGAHTLEIL
jgi:hypothetical protein